MNNFLKDFGLFILAGGLFVGGVVILGIGIPFWSLLLGITSIQIGIVLIIVTFDAFIRRSNHRGDGGEFKTVTCLVCGAPTVVAKYVNVAMCDNCQVRAAKSFKAAGLLIFTLITLSSGLFLVGQNQDLRKQASDGQRVCEDGDWIPGVCRCGVWISGSDKRVCEDGQIRKCLKNGLEWKCTF